jgi:hypothetical protein
MESILLCLDCEETFTEPRVYVDHTKVPYGSMWVDMESDAAETCPYCDSENMKETTEEEQDELDEEAQRFADKAVTKYKKAWKFLKPDRVISQELELEIWMAYRQGYFSASRRSTK